MNDCVFCKILSGKIPASVVHEEEQFIVIMDAYPLGEGHCLVIPKQHHMRLEGLNADQRARLFELGYQVMSAQKACGLGLNGSNLLLNDGKAANQTVPHLHLHLIPRKQHDLIKSLPKLILHVTGVFGLQTKRSTLDLLAKQLAQALKYQLDLQHVDHRNG